MTTKKVHVGKNGKPRCVTRLSAHVSHGPAIVVPLYTFQDLSPAQQCRKCLKVVATSIAALLRSA